MLKPWLLLDCTCAKHRDVFWVLEPYLVRAGFELVRCTSAQEMRTRVVEAMNDDAEGEQRQCVMLLANVVHSPHLEGALKRSCGIGIGNEYGSVEERTPYILPFADVVISDVSSVMFEFCYFERSVVQLRMSSYPDNPTLDYELPTCTDDLSRLSLGVSTRPDGLVACVTEALAAESFEKGTRPAMHGVLEKKKELDVERRDGAQELAEYIRLTTSV